MQNKDLKDLSDIEFSNLVIKHSKIGFVKDHQSSLGEIVTSLGALIEDSDNNTFYDLRSNRERPFWGHNHPLMLRARSRSLDFFLENIKYSSNTSSDDMLRSSLIRYIDTILVLGGRSKFIEGFIAEKLKNFSKISFCNFEVAFKSKDKSKMLHSTIRNGIHISDFSFRDENIIFNIPWAITDDQLTDCISRIIRIYEESLCF